MRGILLADLSARVRQPNLEFRGTFHPINIGQFRGVCRVVPTYQSRRSVDFLEGA